MGGYNGLGMRFDWVRGVLDIRTLIWCKSLGRHPLGRPRMNQ